MLPTPVVCLRLPRPAYARLRALHQKHFAALSMGALTRFLILDQLAKNEQEITEIVMARLRTPQDVFGEAKGEGPEVEHG